MAEQGGRGLCCATGDERDDVRNPWTRFATSSPHSRSTALTGTSHWTTWNISVQQGDEGPAQNGSSVLDRSWTVGGVGRPLQEPLGAGCGAGGNMPEGVQLPSFRRLRGWQTPGFGQHAVLVQCVRVAAGEGGVSQLGGDIEERLFGFGGLEHEQDQGEQSTAVALGVAALEVAAVGEHAVPH